ncbi:MAG: hypothetical protein AAFQ63_16680 [Cyanobacteria bacterium J06621_11]
MDQIQLQASKLWDLLFSEDTAETYQNTLNLTGKIIKEAAQLIWLIICSVFVFGAWVGDTSMKTGNDVRTWLDQQNNPESSAVEKKPIAETGKELIATGRSGVDYLLNQAREQLGLEPVEPAPVRKPSMPKAVKTAAAPKPSTPAPASTSQATTSSQPTGTTPASTASASGPSASNPSASDPKTASDPTAEITREVADDGWGSQESE